MVKLAIVPVGFADNIIFDEEILKYKVNEEIWVTFSASSISSGKVGSYFTPATSHLNPSRFVF